MRVSFETESGAIQLDPSRCLIAGWTGRDAAAVAHHIEELAAIGVPRPSTTPLYYRCPAALLTQADRIEVLGGETGGEAEPVILDDGARRWLALGSDHTDRGLEAVSVAHSKAVCAKPISAAAWALDSVADRLDALRLSSEISADGATWEPYQQGTLAAIRPLQELIDGAPGGAAGAALFCGTLPAVGGVRPTPYFRAVLEDPVAARRLTLDYRAEILPVIA